MNFHGLVIEPQNFYVDLAFRKGAEAAKLARQKKVPDKVLQGELSRIESISQTLDARLENIIKCFPNVDKLDPFYLELIKCNMDYVVLKKSLGTIDWAQKKIKEFTKKYQGLFKKSQSKRYPVLRKEYLGRIASVLKQAGKALSLLESARRMMRDFPTVKTGMFTVCIFGFPNVGKSTLLKKLTSANPEINSYPFTTKTLNIGYMQVDYRKIQFIDTPGTLDRFDKMNPIEKQAHLAIEHVADLVIYVFDPTEEYPLKDQISLFKKIKKPTFIYISKSDVAESSKIRKKFADAVAEVEVLKENIIREYKKST